MPKRYFEVVGERSTLELDVNEEGLFMDVGDIKKSLNVTSNLREINKQEFDKLTKEFTRN